MIPESVRKRLDLKEGSQFLIMGNEDVVILKRVVSPDMAEFESLIKQVRQQAKEAGLKSKDITDATAKARVRKQESTQYPPLKYARIKSEISAVVFCRATAKKSYAVARPCP